MNSLNPKVSEDCTMCMQAEIGNGKIDDVWAGKEVDGVLKSDNATKCKSQLTSPLITDDFFGKKSVTITKWK